MTESPKKKLLDGKYEVISVVGRGSGSVVYHAKNTSGDKGEVALKVLIGDKKDISKTDEKLRREALATVSCYHRYVIRLDDFRTIGNLCYLTLEYAPEHDLRKFTAKRGGKVSYDIVELFFTQCAEALEYIHKIGIIHRDIKPDNILVSSEKEIRIGDFGVALLPGDPSAIDELKKAVGTLDYMAPEVLEGTASDQKSDIFALGVSFYEMLSGKHPFAGVPLAKQLDARKSDAYPPLKTLVPDVPDHLASIITQCLEYDPKKRFPGAKQLLEQLALSKIRGTEFESRMNLTDKKSDGTELEDSSSKNAPRRERQATVISKDPFPKMLEELSKTTPTETENKEEKLSRQPTVALSSEEVKNLTDKQTKKIPYTDEDEDDVDDDVDFNAQDTKTNHLRELLIKNIPIIAFVVLVLGWWFLPAPKMKDATKNKSNIVAQKLIATSLNTLPTVKEAIGLSPFPKLPTGTYAGNIAGFKGNLSKPLVIIVNAKKREATFIIGIDGWMPQTVSLDESVNNTLRIASNGLVFDLTGETTSEKIEGNFQGVTTTDFGSWSVIPILESANNSGEKK